MQRERMPLFKERNNITMTTGIERIAAKAQTNSSLIFTSLAHHITDELLLEELNKLKTSRSSGIDNESVKMAKQRFSEWSPKMLKQVHQKGYQAPRIKRVFIPKPGKEEKRPLGIPTVTDTVLQRSVARVVGAIFEQDFSKSSFGGRPGCSAHQAISKLVTSIHLGRTNYVLEADIKNFFGSLDHTWMMKFVEQRVKDRRILSLIRRWLKAGICSNGELVRPFEGTPQGGPVSVLLSNIFLHFVLDLWIEKVVRPRMTGEVYFVRYIDDFVLCFQRKNDALRFYSALPKRLSKFGLQLEPSKTRLIEFGRYAYRDAKRLGKRPQTFYFLGFTFVGKRSGKGSFKIELRTEKKRNHRAHQKIKELVNNLRHAPISFQINRINALLRGLYRYYGVLGNNQSIRNFYRCAMVTWRKSLSRRSQKGKITWAKYEKILDYFKLAKPEIYLNYQDVYKASML